jgi:peptide deformylase
VVFFVAGPRNDGVSVPLTTLINPVWEVLDAAEESGYEGCLSLPGLTGRVGRARSVRYRGFDRDGRLVERVAEGFHARVVQHECDHLDGILYPMRMNDLASFGFVEEVRRAAGAE